MAEYSGFFQSMWDESKQNPITEEYTGWWDRDYTAKQFMDYFKLFIGNGVFGSPTNQCRVIPGTGLSVIITPGWAFINGAWYHNDSNKILAVPSNGGYNNRYDSVRLRYDDSTRTILGLYFAEDLELVRGETIYDLELAEITIPPASVEVPTSNIVDKRTDESVCGLVKGLMEIETTADLFAQYEAIFNEWFDTVKDQVTGDLAIRLQQEFTELNQNVEDYYENTQEQVEIASGLVENYVNNDYVIQEREFVFVNKVCTILDEKVKSTSLIDVYFTAETISEAEDCQIIVDSSNGQITLTSVRQPVSSIRGYIRVRVN